MTRHSSARYVLAVLSAAVLTACGGETRDVDESAAEAGVSSEQQTDDDRSTGGGTDGAEAEEEAEEEGGEEAEEETGGNGRAGGPDPDGGGSEAARPGGPFDVEAFEQIGQDADEFLPVGRAYCSGGRCTLVEQTVVDPERPVCQVADFAYDPPARPEDAQAADQFIQRGTTVTVFIACPPAGEGETDADGTDADGTDADGTDADGTDADGTDADGTDADGTDTDGTDTDGTDTEEIPAEEPAE